MYLWGNCLMEFFYGFFLNIEGYCGRIKGIFGNFDGLLE